MYKKHLFICCNERKPGDGPTTGCGTLGGDKLLKYLKDNIKEKKLNKEIRINRCGCLGKCRMGPCAVLYPKGEWYGGQKIIEKQEKILEKALIGDGTVSECLFNLEDVLKKKPQR
ncbi:ferredoxin [Candidatus Riflebacteria bacterium]